MLPDHPHVQNVTTPLHQCRLLWIVANIFAWLSRQSSGTIWEVTRKSQHADCSFVEIQNIRRILTAESGFYVVPSPTRREFASDYYRSHHIQVFFAFFKTKILILTFEGLRLAPHRAPDLFFLSFWQDQSVAFNCLWEEIPTTVCMQTMNTECKLVPS